MSIITKTGDEGMTSLVGGHRVLKCDDRVEAYGTVDELSAFIGVLYDMLTDAEPEIKDLLMEIQKNLLTIEAVLACPDKGLVLGLDAGTLTLIETTSQELEGALPPFRSFILPGGNLVASYCHVCRTVCRRAERLAVKVGTTGVELMYLNRLSDLFFLLARKYSFDNMR